MTNFDLIAENYDTDARTERAKAVADEIRKHVIDGKNKSAIEFGCGTGLVGLELLDSFDSIIFMDSSAGMIKQVEQKLLNMNTEKSQAICCDLTEGVPDNLSADYIFSSLVLHHIVDTKAILTRLFSLLNKDGHLLIIDLNIEDGSFHSNHNNYDGHNGFEQPILKELVLKVGFKKAEIQTFYHGKKFVNENAIPYSLFILDAVK
jgi:ubiquinone/menaquinone biosynthesis C-methylase UbiE